jgi:hypothetical protein
MREKFPFQGAGGELQKQPVQHTPIEAAEGVSGQQVLVNGQFVNVDRAVSLTQIRTLDLVSEGPIEGLVTGEYRFVGTLGNVGYTSATFIPFEVKNINGQSVTWLRSIYWNETPVVDKDNLFNFQQVDVAVSYGEPNGDSIAAFNDNLTVSRLINERLRGPNSTVTSSTSTERAIGEVEQFAKTYRILNRDCRSCNVNVRVNALSETIIKGDNAGDVDPAAIFYRIYYKPLFSNARISDTDNY